MTGNSNHTSKHDYEMLSDSVSAAEVVEKCLHIRNEKNASQKLCDTDFDKKGSKSAFRIVCLFKKFFSQTNKMNGKVSSNKWGCRK